MINPITLPPPPSKIHNRHLDSRHTQTYTHSLTHTHMDCRKNLPKKNVFFFLFLFMGGCEQSCLSFSFSCNARDAHTHTLLSLSLLLSLFSISLTLILCCNKCVHPNPNLLQPPRPRTTFNVINLMIMTCKIRSARNDCVGIFFFVHILSL